MWPFTTSKTTPAGVNGPAQILDHASTTEIAPQPVMALEPEPELDSFSITGVPDTRLSIPFLVRAPLLVTSSFFVGFMLGSAHGAPIAAYRYRAENAHRMPTTPTGWFLYQKSKNYHSIIGGVKEGIKLGGVLSAWATLFMTCEEVVDNLRGQIFAKGEEEFAKGQRDVASTVTAAMATAGVYSWKRGMDVFTSAKTAKTALKYSFIYGVVQDMAATLRGNRPAYVDWVARKIFGQKSTIGY